MTTVRQVVELTRAARNAAGIKTKQPLAALYVLGENDSERLVDYTETIKDETNVKEIELKEKEGLFTYSVKLDFAAAGPRLGKRVGEAKQALAQIEQLQIKELIENGKINISDLELTTADVILEKVPSDQLLLSEGNGLSVLLDTKLTTELKEEGFVREVIREVQTYRKELDLPVEKRVNLYVDASPAVIDVMKKYTDMLYHNLVLQEVRFSQYEKVKSVEMEGQHLQLGVE